MSFVFFALGVFSALTIRNLISRLTEGLVFNIALEKLAPKIINQIEKINFHLEELENLKKVNGN